MSTRRVNRLRPAPFRASAAGWLPVVGARVSAAAVSANLVTVLAKEPVAGRVKTRLCPPLLPDQAAALAAAFAVDTLEALAGVDGLPGLEVRLALDRVPLPSRPDGPIDRAAAEDTAAVARRLGFGVEDQRGADLGERMARLVALAVAGGSRCVLVGTDAPDLPSSRLVEAFAALRRVDVVLGPATDGGYVLVGARRVVPALFSIDAEWGGRDVLEATLASLSRAQVSFELLEEWEDVDDAAALGRLAARLRGAGPNVAPSTSRLLLRWETEGVRF